MVKVWCLASLNIRVDKKQKPLTWAKVWTFGILNHSLQLCWKLFGDILSHCAISELCAQNRCVIKLCLLMLYIRSFLNLWIVWFVNKKDMQAKTFSIKHFLMLDLSQAPHLFSNLSSLTCLHHYKTDLHNGSPESTLICVKQSMHSCLSLIFWHAAAHWAFPCRRWKLTASQSEVIHGL